jgi:hypothetical protein
LLEQEIRKAHDKAAHMYLSIITEDGDVGSEEYQSLKSHIIDLQFNLNMINLLIDRGAK